MAADGGAKSVEHAVVAALVLELGALSSLAAPTAAGVQRRVEVVRDLGVEVLTVDSTDPDQAVVVLQASLAELDSRGVGAGLVALICGAHRAVAEAAGRFDRLHCIGVHQAADFLDEQVRARRCARVPTIDRDPAWLISRTSTDPLTRRICEAIFTLGAGGFAVRGAVDEGGAGSVPLVLAAGVYTGAGPEETLAPAPEHTTLRVTPAPEDDVRALDMRTGVLLREETPGGNAEPFRSMRFASVVLPGVVALRAEAAIGRLGTAELPAHAEGEPAVAAVERDGRCGAVRTLERVAGYALSTAGSTAAARAEALIEAAVRRGFDRMLGEHRAAWARRWDCVDVRIPDDPSTQLAVRFALFQLWNNVARHDEMAVGARGLSGTGYRGHVFWDADVFVLPAMVSIDPAAARAMLTYRLNRIDAARRAAAAGGRRGARFPWESASSGRDVTPVEGVVGPRVVPIRTGPLEEHITADVAWATARYLAWTGDDAAASVLSPLLVDTARYWAARCRQGADGCDHIDAVIGPDEYHENVDDNAYTNVMARWNLRAGAAAARALGGDAAEIRQWERIADRLVDGYDAATGRHEQFAGYFGLESLLIAEIAQPPVAADVLLGHDRVGASQLIKQPDVLMLHHLLPEECEPGSLAADLDFYLPRTAHGSSLSPSITAAVLARAGRPDQALAMLRHALTLDLEDTTGMAAAGLHLANLGGIWQAVLTGFLGVTVHGQVITLDPVLPSAWRSLEVRFRCLGRNVGVRIGEDDAVLIDADAGLSACLAGHDPHPVSGPTRLGVVTRP